MNEFMLSEIDTEFLGQKLRDARKSRGLTQDEVAQILNVSRATIIAIEQGKRKVTEIELAKLAYRYGRDVDEFLSTDRGISVDDIQFRARYRVTTQAQKTEEYQAAFSRVCQKYYELQDILGLSPLIDKYPPEYSVQHTSPVQAAEYIATRERHRLGLDDRPIQNLRDLLELEVGIHIFYMNLGEISGMYFFTAPLGGCVAINGQHPEPRRRWSTAHEYGHFLTTRYEADITVYSNEGDTLKSDAEKIADTFAKYFLMPTSSIIVRFSQLVEEAEKFTPAALLTLAYEYGVSTEAMARRLESERLLPTGAYDRLLETGFRPLQAAKDLRIPEVMGRNDEYPIRYQRLVDQAYHRGLLDEESIASYLDVDIIQARQIIVSADEFSSSLNLLEN